MAGAGAGLGALCATGATGSLIYVLLVLCFFFHLPFAVAAIMLRRFNGLQQQ